MYRAGSVFFNCLDMLFGAVALMLCKVILRVLFVIFQKIIVGIDVPGYPTLVVLILFLGGMQLTVLGIIGEYLARIHIESKHRPIFLERGCYRCEKKK